MLNRKEILRYLGASGCNDTLAAMIDQAESEVIAASRPKHIYRHVNMVCSGSSISICGVQVNSKDLAAHLRGCTEGFLLACTLGIGVDSLVKRYTFTDISMLPVIQATAAAYIEHHADAAQKKLEEYAQKHGKYLRPRYSPGYGDFQLSWQRHMFDLLDLSKKIGVTLTDSFLMVPFKSVTAVIGLSNDPSLCHVGKCMICSAENCPFRKEEPSDV